MYWVGTMPFTSDDLSHSPTIALMLVYVFVFVFIELQVDIKHFPNMGLIKKYKLFVNVLQCYTYFFREISPLSAKKALLRFPPDHVNFSFEFLSLLS